MPFIDPSEVRVTQLDAPHYDSKFWRLDRALLYRGATGEVFEVPADFNTDFASVPRVFAWFLPRYGRYTKAAILHDWLWEQAKVGEVSWRDADGLFRRAMRELRVPFLRRWIMWTGVRWASLRHLADGGGKEWWKDSPAVLGFTVVGLPLVAPPAVLIIGSLAVFYAYEAITFAGLCVGRRTAALFGVTAENDLNPPGFSLTTS